MVCSMQHAGDSRLAANSHSHAREEQIEVASLLLIMPVHGRWAAQGWTLPAACHPSKLNPLKGCALLRTVRPVQPTLRPHAGRGGSAGSHTPVRCVQVQLLAHAPGHPSGPAPHRQLRRRGACGAGLSGGPPGVPGDPMPGCFMPICHLHQHITSHLKAEIERESCDMADHSWLTAWSRAGACPAMTAAAVQSEPVEGATLACSIYHRTADTLRPHNVSAR